MSGEQDTPVELRRVPTGAPGLDAILGGGYFEGGLYIVTGRPGAGKTTLANQMSFATVAAGGRALYVTLLAETHGRMLAHLAQMRFFDAAPIGRALRYVNGFTAVQASGLAGLLDLLRNAVREHHADLLVLDGMPTVSNLPGTSVDYKRFISELQAWVGVMGCTVLLLTSEGSAAGERPENTMVDGIVELATAQEGMRALRELRISKFRGSAYAEGAHAYAITDAGVEVYPRLEAQLTPAPLRPLRSDKLGFGIPDFDRMLGGGVGGGSVTLLLGSSGAGKSILGMHFLAEGARRGENSLLFGFFEMPPLVLARGDRLGLELSRHEREGRFGIRWHKPAERTLDALAYDLLTHVEKHKIQRLFIDGLVGFKNAPHPERLAGFFSVLMKQLAVMGVTVVITEETRELFIRQLEVPTPGVSAIFDNIVLMRQAESHAELLRLVAVMKTRDTAHDRNLYRFEITETGIEIRDRFEGQGVILGVPGRDGDAGPGGGR